ncbi:hypothetical protein [Vibrio phage vB_VhaS-tm]|nr:hypothetical protein [Vibrio phage vB_VhaS-tm]
MSKRNYPHTAVTATITAGSDTRDPWAVAYGDELGRALFLFPNMTERDAFTTAYPPRLYKSWCFVKDNGSGVPKWFEWSGALQDGSDGTWSPLKIMNDMTGGITFVNADGSTTGGVEMLALQGLELQGNNKDGFTLVAQNKGGSNSFDIENIAKDASYNVKGATGLKLGPYLEAYPDPDSGKAVLLIKPGSFDKASVPAMLAYLQDPVDIYGKNHQVEKIHKGAIWCDDIVYSDDTYIPMSRKDKTIGLQEYDGLDPNVTGGDRFFVGVIVNLSGEAPDDGAVRAAWYDITTGQIARDMNGQYMAVERAYKRGEQLTPEHNPLFLVGVMSALGLENYRLVVTDSFTNDIVRILDYSNGPTGFIVQSLSGNVKASPAMNQFIEDTGFDVRPEVRYLGDARAMVDIYTHEDQANYETAKGVSATSATGFSIEAKSKIQTQVANGCFIVSSNDIDITDFMVKLVFTNVETRMLRGKQVTVPISLMDKDSGWNVGLFSWEGEPDEFTDVYASRSNGLIVLNKDWKLVDTKFITENVVLGLHDESFTFTVPNSANNYVIGLWPTQAQNPLHLQLKHFSLNVTKPFWGYSLKPPKINNLAYLHQFDLSAVFVQNSQGYYSLRYTLTTAVEGDPLPLGIAQHKLPETFYIDSTLNLVGGTEAKGGEGALVCNDDGELTFQFTFSLWNEQKVDTTASFWLVKFDDLGNPTRVGDVQTFPVKAGSQNVERQTEKITVSASAGDKFGLRGNSNIRDGAFLECNNDAHPLVKTFVTFKGLTT